MGKLDFKDALHFNEFPPVSTDEWEAVIESDLKGKNYKDVLRWVSGEGIDPLPFYRDENLGELEHPPVPVHQSGSWNIIEPIESSDIQTANKYALHALENGASGLLFAPSKNFLNNKKDLQELLNDIQIELITLQFGRALSTPETLYRLQEICAEKAIEESGLQITFNFDPFSQSMHSGSLPTVDFIDKTLKKFGKSFRFCTVDASIYGNAGATIVQQLAFALGAGNEYLGLNSELSKNLYFNFSAGPNYFLEIAKIRAFKLLWLQVASEYGTNDLNPLITAETAAWNASKTDAHNNMLRCTTEAMSAALGGCDAIAVHRYDYHFSEPSSFASRIARNIQLILQEEAYLNKVADPGAGSYYIEKLTDSLIEESWKLFQKLEAKGGFHAGLQSGFVQELINQSRQEKINAYKENKKVLVGVNKYQPEDKAQGVRHEVQGFPANLYESEALIEIKKVLPLNIEAELQKGDA